MKTVLLVDGNIVNETGVELVESVIKDAVKRSKEDIANNGSAEEENFLHFANFALNNKIVIEGGLEKFNEKMRTYLISKHRMKETGEIHIQMEDHILVEEVIGSVLDYITEYDFLTIMKNAYNSDDPLYDFPKESKELIIKLHNTQLLN